MRRALVTLLLLTFVVLPASAATAICALMGYLAEAGTQFQPFRATQATTVWNGRDSLNRVSSRWVASSTATADWRTQASALSAILATG